MNQIGIKPGDIKQKEDLRKLPILTKKIIQEQQEALKSKEFVYNKVYRGRTGGSTSEPLTYFHDLRTQTVNRASHHRGLSWSGFEWGEPLVGFFGGTLGLNTKSWEETIRSFITNQNFFPAFEISPSKLDEILKIIENKNPKALIGYTSSLQYLASLIIINNKKVTVPITFTTGETLLEDTRSIISTAFNSKVYDYYGFGEIQGIAYQCSCGYYHLSDEKIITEILPIKEYENSIIGHAIFTDLTNHTFPFIRYESGDILEVSKIPCSCGRALTPVKRIVGRIHDFISTPDGKFLAGEFFPHLFRNFNSFLYYQVIQDEPDHLKILYVPAPTTDDIIVEKRVITEKIKQYTSSIMKIDFKEVDEIPRTASGKLRSTVNLISNTKRSNSISELYIE